MQPDCDGILSQKGSKVIPYIAALFDGQAYTLFLLWVPTREGAHCPGNASATDALVRGGAARVPMRLHATLSFKLVLS